VYSSGVGTVSVVEEEGAARRRSCKKKKKKELQEEGAVRRRRSCKKKKTRYQFNVHLSIVLEARKTVDVVAWEMKKKVYSIPTHLSFLFLFLDTTTYFFSRAQIETVSICPTPPIDSTQSRFGLVEKICGL